MYMVILPVQVMQAQCVKAQTEFYLRSRTELIDGKGRTMGALYWQLNDIWQAPSWSSIGRFSTLFHGGFYQNGSCFKIIFFSACRVWWEVENAALFCTRLFRSRPACRLWGRWRSAHLRRFGPESRHGACGCGTSWSHLKPGGRIDPNRPKFIPWSCKFQQLQQGFSEFRNRESLDSCLLWQQKWSLFCQVTVYSWADLDSVCTLKSDRRLVPAGSAVAVFQQPVATLLAGCGRCTRVSCLLTFHLEDGDGQQGPTNHHFLSSPKDAQGLQRPNITVRLSDKQVFYFSL